MRYGKVAYMPARRFKSLTVSQLETMRDALLAFFSATGPVSSGMQSYTIAGRAVSRMSPSEIATILDEVSNELAVRALPDRDEIGLAEF